jgi:hypothetical protein
MPSTRDRTGATALAGAAVTGLIAFALVIAGAFLLWANGHYKDADGYLTTGSEPFASTEYAITSDKLEINGHWPLSSNRYGTVRLTAHAKDKPMFIGVARTTDVDAYLRDVAHSRVDDISYAPFSARYTPIAGQDKPARPADQRIWSAQAHGDGTRSLTWKVEKGDWSIVVMNEDGSRGVTTSVGAGAKVPYIAELAYAALGAGLLFIIATAALTTYGTRPAPARRRLVRV